MFVTLVSVNGNQITRECEKVTIQKNGYYKNIKLHLGGRKCLTFDGYIWKRVR